MATVEALLTADEFAALPDDGRRTELVRGRIVELPPPKFRHGRVCNEISFALTTFVKAAQVGQVLTNDSGIVTERDPDTVRGVDVTYFSYERIPKGRPPVGYPDVCPELVIEVRSPGDRWKDILVKVAEYVKLGVSVVCVLDPDSETAHLYYPDKANISLGRDDELTFPECLPGFRVIVRTLFE